jgi:hypothetical protein
MVSSFVTDRIQVHLNQREIVGLVHVGVLLERLEVFHLADLRQVHLVLDHGVPRLHEELFAVVGVDPFGEGPLRSVQLHLDVRAVGLVFLQHLLAREDFLNLAHHLAFDVSVENVMDCLHFVVHDKELTFVFSGASPFKQNADVAFYEVELLEAQHRHV